jgi:rhodanese-related sulfurtransferase
LAAKDLAGELARGAVLIDLAPGMTYRKGHIEGARWANRARLDRLGLAKGTRVVLAAEDPQIAALAALDLTEAGMVVAGRLAGGSEEWKAAGLRLTATPDVPAQADCIDYLFFVHDRHEGNLDAARGYLAWEIGLVGQMDEQERGLLRPLM